MFKLQNETFPLIIALIFMNFRLQMSRLLLKRVGLFHFVSFFLEDEHTTAKKVADTADKAKQVLATRANFFDMST